MDNWILLAIAGFTLSGVSTAVDKHFMNKGYQPLSTNLLKMFFDGVILLGIGYFFFDLNLTLNLFWWSLLLGLLYSLAGIFYFKTLQFSAVDAIFPYIQSLTALFAIFGSVITFNEVFELPNYIGLILNLIGIYLVLSKTGFELPKLNKGLFFGTLIVITMVVYFLLTKMLLGNVQPIDLAVMMYLCSGLILGIYKIITSKKHHRLPELKSAKILISAIFAATGTFFIFSALSIGLASKVYALSGWQSVIIFIIAAIFLKQKLYWHRLLGIILILPGIYLISI